MSPIASIIVPAYREAQNIARLTTRVFAALRSADITAELIIVDDNSGDGIQEIVRSLAEQYPVRVIVRKDERGLSTAVVRGLQEAVGQFVVVMDADLSHPPETIPQMLTELQNPETDFVIGSRYTQGASVDQTWGWFRRMNSRVAGWLARGLTKAGDPMAGFFALRRSTLGDLADLNPCGYKIGLEIMVRRRCRSVVEIPIHFADREYGDSKLNFREQLAYLRHLGRLYAFRMSGFAAGARSVITGLLNVCLDVVAAPFVVLLIGIRMCRLLLSHAGSLSKAAFHRRPAAGK